MLFTTKTQSVLEFDKIREMLSSLCSTEGSKARALTLTPSDDYDTVITRQARTYDAGRYINHWYTIESRNVGAWYDETKASGFVIEGKNQSYFKAEIAFVCGDYEYATYLPVNELLNSPYWLKTLKKQLAQEKDFAKFYAQLCKIDAYFYAHNMDGSSEHDVLQDLMKRCVSRIASEKLIK